MRRMRVLTIHPVEGAAVRQSDHDRRTRHTNVPECHQSRASVGYAHGGALLRK